MTCDRNNNRQLMNIINDLILILMMIVAIPSSGFANSYTLYPTDDSLVNSSKPTQNYATAYLSVYYDYREWNLSYLKFDLSSISDSAVIIKAELHLFSSLADNNPVVDLNYITDDNWIESTITWNYRPVTDGVLLDAKAPEYYKWQTFNLLKGNQWNYAADLIDNKLSLILKEGENLPAPSITKQAQFFSDEDHQKDYMRPYLYIEIVPEPTTMLLLGLGLIGLAIVGRKSID